jgi:hypothetical protein
MRFPSRKSHQSNTKVRKKDEENTIKATIERERKMSYSDVLMPEDISRRIKTGIAPVAVSNHFSEYPTFDLSPQRLLHPTRLSRKQSTPAITGKFSEKMITELAVRRDIFFSTYCSSSYAGVADSIFIYMYHITKSIYSKPCTHGYALYCIQGVHHQTGKQKGRKGWKKWLYFEIVGSGGAFSIYVV